MSTIKDVARLAGVSVGTVSNYLNGTRPVSRQTAARIKEVVDQLGFTPNLSARSLKANVYSEIALLLPNRSDPCCVQICQGAEAALQGSGYMLHVSFTYDLPELERSILQDLLKKRICGLILMSCQPDQGGFFRTRLADVPMVLLEREIEGLQTDLVRFDNEAAMQRMTGRLLDSNYSRVCLFCGPKEFSCEASCVQGFEQAHLLRGRQPGPIVQTELSREDGFRKLTRLLQNQRPDAILATSESTAVGVTEGLQLLGCGAEHIPVMTLGEEHWNLRTHSFATCATARPAIRMGRQAAELLLQRLRTPESVPQKVTLQETGCWTGILPPKRQEAEERPARETLRVLTLDTTAVRAFAGLLSAFEHETGIHVDLMMLPHRSLLPAIEDQQMQYDVCMLDIPWLPKLAAAGVLRDLSEVTASLGTDRFFPDAMTHYSMFRGRSYGVPFLYAPQVFYYRKDLFESPALRSQYERRTGSTLRPPITLEEFNAIAGFFTHQTDAIAYGAGLASAYDECFAPEIYLRLQAYGGSIIDSRGEVCIESAAARRAYQNLLQCLPVVKPDYRSATDTSIVSDFLRGETAMVISYPAFLTDVADLRKASMIGEIGYALCPGRTPLLGGWSLGVSARTGHPAAAERFLQWCCAEQTASYFALLGGQSVITSTYTNDELVSLYPWLPLYHSTYAHARPTAVPTLPNGKILSSDQVDAIVCKWAGRLLDGTCSVEQTLRQTRLELENMIDSYRLSL